MRTAPMMLMPSNKRTLFSGTGPSSMKSSCCGTAGDVVPVGNREDAFVRSQSSSVSSAVSDDDSAALSDWETFPLLDAYKLSLTADDVLTDEQREKYKV